MQVVSTAKYKILTNRKHNTVRIVCAFNVYKQYDEEGNAVFRFPVQSKCEYVSGDLNSSEDVANTLQTIAHKLNANLVQVG
jgi:hypothetical protein